MISLVDPAEIANVLRPTVYAPTARHGPASSRAMGSTRTAEIDVQSQKDADADAAGRRTAPI